MGPGTFTTLAGKKLKIHKTKVTTGSGKPGEVLVLKEQSMVVAAGEGALEIFEIQPESRSRISVAEFLKGYPMKKGDLLGTASA